MNRTNQTYTLLPQPSPTGELRLVVVTHGAISVDHAHRLVSDLSAALVNLAQLPQCDGIEEDPCVGLDGHGTVTDYMSATAMERYPASDAGACAADIGCWTVYGHLADGGSVAFLDFPTREDARAAADVLRIILRRQQPSASV